MLKNAHKHQLWSLSFTKRELDVCACIVSGRFSRKSIANVLKISPATVASYLRSIMQKIQCSSVEQVRSYIEASDHEEKLRSYFRTIIGKEKDEDKIMFLGNEMMAPSSQRVNINTLNYLAVFAFIKNLIAALSKSTYLVIGCVLFLSFIYLSNLGIISFTCTNLRSEFIVPEDKFLLKRSELIAKISKELTIQSSAKESIPVIILVGVGGAGKTTLARLFAKSHKGMAWEINAETKTTLETSLRDLAYYCVRTKVDKERIDFIQTISNESERALQIILFIKDKIKDHPNWLLIYDNVESLDIIKNYLPFEPKSWGSGQVIITTRNENIRRGHQIKIDALQESEILKLFRQTSQQTSRLSPQEKNNLLFFLRKIPPYPLDIVIAGRYLHESKISQQDYLLCMGDKNDQIQQREVLSGAQSYTQTRYDIIDISLTRLIKENPEYLKLLLLISHVDSQNIPTHLCSQLTNTQITQKFIRQMRSASLITITKDIEHEGSLISFHRSIQAGIATWLENCITVDRLFSDNTFEKIVITLENYIHKNLRLERYEELVKIRPHLEQLINTKIIPQESHKILKAAYGCLLCCLERFTFDTFQYLEAGLEIKDLSNDYRASLIQFYCGYILGNWGQYTKSIYYTEKSVETIKRKYFNSLEYFTFINNLACMYRCVGRYQESRQLLEEAQKVQLLYPKNYRAVAEYLSRYPLILRDEGKYKEALAGMLKSVNVLSNNQKPLLNIAQPYHWLNTIQLELGYFQTALKGFENYPDFGSGYIDTMAYSGVCQYYLGNYLEAKRLLEESYEAFKKSNYICNYNAFKCCIPILGRVYIHYGLYKNAREVLEECLRYSEKLYGKDKFQSARIICYFGELDMAEGNIGKAEQNMLLSYRLLHEEDHTDLYVPLESLAMLYLEKSRLAKERNDIVVQKEFNKMAQIYLYEASRLIKDRFPPDSAHIKRIERKKKELRNMGFLPTKVRKPRVS